jgi:YHS domain-containing protein
MKLLLVAAILITTSTSNAKDKACPLMVEDEIDPEESVTVEGREIEFCCGTCVRKFEENKAYYIKAVKYLNEIFTPDQREKLGVNDVVLLQQRRCPIYPDRIINPNSPTVEYKDMKIYFWSSSAVRRWNRDPEKYYQAAKAAGILK